MARLSRRPTEKRISGLSVLLVALCALVTAPSAGAYVYWLSYDSANSRVGRANLDGSQKKGSLVDGIYYGAGVASDGKHVFWGESGSAPTLGSIGRATIAGRHVNHSFASSDTYCGTFGVDVRATSLLWLINTCSPGASAIRSAPRSDPVGPATPVSGTSICGFTTDSKHIYWSEGEYIGRANLDGGSADHQWLDIGAGELPCAVAVNSQYVYWTNQGQAPTYRATTIGRATINGAESSVDNAFITGLSFFGGVSSPSGIAVDAKHIYWTNQPPADPPTVYGSIGRASLGGSHVKANFIGHVFDPYSLDVDGQGP